MKLWLVERSRMNRKAELAEMADEFERRHNAMQAAAPEDFEAQREEMLAFVHKSIQSIAEYRAARGYRAAK